MNRRASSLPWLGVLLVLVLGAALVTQRRRGAFKRAEPAPSAHAACTKPISVYLVGDSTMSVYPSERAPRMGWGQPLAELFAPECAQVKDMAISGRSAKSFYDEGAWTPVQDALTSGDYVLIQFGHNDEKKEDPKRYTDPQTTFKAYLTMFVMDTRQKLATPLLLTPINRNKWQGGTLADTHGAYPGAVRELAQALGVELVDLTALTKTYFERLGQAETSKLFMNLAPGQSANYPDGSSDDTHLQESGARLIGRLALADVAARKLGIAQYLRAAPVAP